MKKIATIILILGLSFQNVSAQATPMHKVERSTNTPTKEVEGKVDSRTREDGNEFLQFEIKAIRTSDGTKFIIPKIDIESFEFKDQKKLEKIKFLNRLQEMSTKESFQLVTELSKNGFRVVSHSFQMNKDQEIHYYIVEL